MKIQNKYYKQVWVHMADLNELKVSVLDKFHPNVLREIWQETTAINLCKAQRTGTMLKDWPQFKKRNRFLRIQTRKTSTLNMILEQLIKQWVVFPSFPWSSSLSNNEVHHLQVEPL